VAEKLEAFPENRGRPAGSFIYPWADWCDGSVWKATKDADFQIRASMFRDSLYTRAANVGMKVRTSVVGDSVIFQFYKPDSP
jgi:hypothetical protein